MDDNAPLDFIPKQPETTKEPGPEGKPLTYEETPVMEPPQEQSIKDHGADADWLKPQQAQEHPQSSDPGQARMTSESEPAQSIPPYTPPHSDASSGVGTPIETSGPPPSSIGGPSYTASPPPPRVKVKRGGCLSLLGTIILFIVLFVAGIALSSVLRQFVPTGLPSFGGPATSQATPTPTDEDVIAPTRKPTGSGTTTGWKSYSVTNGLTRTAVPGVSFQLPPDVLSPICDGGNCASQGTYLPGGTRFTIAARGPGQVLRDYRGAQVSDALGQLFTVTQTTKQGSTAVDFAGDFTGRTISGYAFGKMHGYMIAIDDTHSIEINHFTPSGITADFAADDVLFEQIVKTLVLPTTSTKGAVLTTPTPTFAPTTPATSSGN